MNKENIPVITDREKLYNKCENMEQLFDKYYLPLLDKHYSKTYELQQENQSLKEQVDYLRRSIERKEETIIELEHERVPYENKYVEELKKQLEEYKEEKREWIDLLDMFKNQQKEFIEYLENMLDNENDIFSVVRVKDILSKYKEILGVSDENNT